MVVLALILRKLPGNKITNPVSLPIYARTGCNSVAATYGLGKTNAIAVIHIGPDWSTDGRY